MANTKYIKNVQALIATSITDLRATSDGQGRKIFNAIISEVSKLQLTKGGAIKPTTANLKILKRVEKRIEGIVLTDKYLGGVKKFIAQFQKVAKLNTTFFKGFDKPFNGNSIRMQIIDEVAINRAEAVFLRGGVKSGVVTPIMDQIRANIGAGGSYVDMVEALSNSIARTESLGIMENYVHTIATDSLNQYHAARIQAGADDLGLEWFLYVGTDKKTSRKFCTDRTGKYYHIDEIKAWADQKWQGRNKATNESNIIELRGGHNCDDQFMPVSDAVVPESTKAQKGSPERLKVKNE